MLNIKHILWFLCIYQTTAEPGKLLIFLTYIKVLSGNTSLQVQEFLNVRVEI